MQITRYEIDKQDFEKIDDNLKSLLIVFCHHANELSYTFKHLHALRNEIIYHQKNDIFLDCLDYYRAFFVSQTLIGKAVEIWKYYKERHSYLGYLSAFDKKKW